MQGHDTRHGDSKLQPNCSVCGWMSDKVCTDATDFSAFVASKLWFQNGKGFKRHCVLNETTLQKIRNWSVQLQALSLCAGSFASCPCSMHEMVMRFCVSHFPPRQRCLCFGVKNCFRISVFVFSVKKAITLKGMSFSLNHLQEHPACLSMSMSRVRSQKGCPGELNVRKKLKIVSGKKWRCCVRVLFWSVFPVVLILVIHFKSCCETGRIFHGISWRISRCSHVRKASGHQV